MDRLLELQATDSAIDRASARLRELESGSLLGAARAAADEAEAALGEIRLSIDALAREQQRLEHEIDSLSQKAAAEERRLYDGSIANAKELESLQHEIENLRRRRSGREDELLEILERREELEGTAKEREETATALRSTTDEVGNDVGRELGSVTEELHTRSSDRAALLSDIDPELVQLYDDVRAQKKGVGAAALVDGVCQGCHEKLSAMERDKLKRAEGVTRCEYCRRILITSPSS
jgi:uncharacterized protein